MSSFMKTKSQNQNRDDPEPPELTFGYPDTTPHTIHLNEFPKFLNEMQFINFVCTVASALAGTWLLFLQHMIFPYEGGESSNYNHVM